MIKRIRTDDGEKKVIADIERFGWHCVHILEENGEPPWSFTVGLYDSWQQPELIIFGLDRDVAHPILNIAAQAISSGTMFDYSLPTDEFLNDYSCCFVEVPKHHYYEYMGMARWFYGGDRFPLYQVVWPSKEGHFPWNGSAKASFREWQPVLGASQIGV